MKQLGESMFEDPIRRIGKDLTHQVLSILTNRVSTSRTHLAKDQYTSEDPTRLKTRVTWNTVLVISYTRKNQEINRV